VLERVASHPVGQKGSPCFALRWIQHPSFTAERGQRAGQLEADFEGFVLERRVGGPAGVAQQAQSIL